MKCIDNYMFAETPKAGMNMTQNKAQVKLNILLMKDIEGVRMYPGYKDSRRWLLSWEGLPCSSFLQLLLILF